MQSGNYRDLPAEVELSQYPEYFRRNFHWQTDGYFSEASAARYDVGVELLFLGMADVMRRQVIPPITRLLRELGRDDLRLLDVACGTGRTLLQLSMTHPDLRYHGLDLSPYYIKFARRLLHPVKHLSLSAENAEAMPYRDEYFDVLVSVHLFHELPRAARRNVIAEMWRVLRPGGLLVIQDSGQLAESPELSFFLSRFASEFHEPYHADYIEDDLAQPLAERGFSVEAVETHFVSKVIVARKNARAAGAVVA